MITRDATPRQFDFLGYTFKPRAATDERGVVFTNFAPAVADKAAVAMRQEMQSWGLGRHNRWSLDEVLARVRPVVTGWVRYNYGLFYPSKLYRALQTLDQHLVMWARRKYKGLAGHTERAWNCLAGLKFRMPRILPHWLESIMATGRYEPDESRDSRPVLGEPGGVIPLGYSLGGGRTCSTSKTLQMTGIVSVGSLPMRLHSREKKFQCPLRQYSKLLHPV